MATSAAREALFAALVYVSEGRSKSTLDAIRKAANSTPPAKLLHSFIDAPYNRSGFTLAGPKDPLKQAVLKTVRTSYDLIDFTTHTATHPRLGAVDHISLHPLRNADLAAAGALVRSLGEIITASDHVPVYLYGSASASSQTLDAIRRSLGYFRPSTSTEAQWKGPLSSPQEGSAATIEPDLGPTFAPPSKGVMTIGAVPWIVNYNIPVTGLDLPACKRIARCVSERGGGLPLVQAMALVHDGNIEIACNILDVGITPPKAVQAFVEARCSEVSPQSSIQEGYFPGLTPEVAIARYDSQVYS